MLERPYLMLYKTSPFGKILTYKFGAKMLWKLPIFSFLKKVSGIHILVASINVKYLILSGASMVFIFNIWYVFNGWMAGTLPFPSFPLICNLSSFHFCLRVIWNLYSWFKSLSAKVRLVIIYTILTSLISEKPLTKILTKMSVAASKFGNYINCIYQGNQDFKDAKE